MKKQTKLENNFLTFARKATLLIGTFGLAACLNTAQAQCPPPTITPSGPVDLCTGGSVTLTATAGASYLWSTGATTQSINVNYAGGFNVTVDDGAGCIVASAITSTTINSLIPGGINNLTGVAKACPMQSHVFSISPASRAVYYVWTLPAGATSGGLSTIQTTSTSITIDFDAGFVAAGNIQITAHNGCGVRGPSTKNVGVDIPLTPSVISGPTTACANGTYTYSTPLAIGVTTYNWTAPAGATISGQGTNQVDITFASGFISGQVAVANQNNCGSGNSRSIVVRSVPSTPGYVVGQTSGVCGATISFSIAPVATATSYTWTAPSGLPIDVVNGQGTTLADIFFNSNLDNGYVRVVANNICGASGERKLRVDGEVVITTNPEDATVCSGTPASFSINALGGNVLFQWQKNGVNLSDGGTVSGATTANLNISAVVAGDAGLYRCIAGNNCSVSDTSEAATLVVAEAPSTMGSITGIRTACDGDAGVAYSIATVAGAANYVWAGFDGATIATGQGTTSVTVDFGPSVNSGYSIKVFAENTCGATADTALAWVRRTVSVPSFSTAPLSACAGQSSVGFDVNTVVGATSYTWTAPLNATVMTGQGTVAVTVDFGPSFTSGQICVTASNTCFTTAPRCKTVISVPSIPGAVTGPTLNVCNSTGTYSINNVPTANDYTWTAPLGASVTSGQGTINASIAFGPTFVSGDVTVIAKNNCGNSPLRVRQVIAAPEKPGAISGNSAPCANSTGNAYSVASVTGATSYVWNIPAGASITSGSGTNSVVISFGNVASALSVKAANACAVGSGSSLPIAFSCKIQSSALNNGFSVYPNPASDKIIISNAEGASGKATVKIIDVTGRVLINEVSDLSNGNIEINISSLNRGVYFIESTSVNGKFVSQFVKE